MPAKEPNSEEIKKTVRDYWMQGYSALWIGNQLGRTRRSIIGIVYRLGLTRVERPGNPVRLAHGEKRATRVFAGRKPIKAILGHKRSDGEVVSMKDIPMPEPSVAAKNGYRKDGKIIKLMELRSNTCRWPIGDPLDKKFGYCGAQTDIACPYCLIHRKIAYYTAKARV